MTREQKTKAAFDYLDDIGSTNIPAGKAFVAGAEWAEKMIIEEACKWMKDNIPDYYGYGKIFPEIIKDFKQAMKE